MKVREAIQIIERDGWTQVRQNGQPSPIPPPGQIRNCRGGGTSVGCRPSQNSGYNQEQAGLKYAVIYETGSGGGYSAYVPDLPGCVAAARTLEATRELMEEAIEFHIEGMGLHGEIVPEPSSLAEMLELA